MAKNNANSKSSNGNAGRQVTKNGETFVGFPREVLDSQDTAKSTGNKRRANRGRGKSNRGASIASPVPEFGRGSSHNTTVISQNSASMQAHGSFITTPGQENFIENFNHVRRDGNPSDVEVKITASGYARRTTNAMAIGITHWFGNTNADKNSPGTSPIQMAALNLKQFVDTSFGTNTNYDPQDLMMYLMGVSAVFPWIAEIRRDLRLVVTYLQDCYPQFVPRGLFTLLRISDDAGRYLNGEGALYAARNLRNYIDQFNQLVTMFNRLPMPPELGVLGINDDLFDCIYTDSPDYSTAQLYVFYNQRTWRYDDTGTEQGAVLWPDSHNVMSDIDQKLAYLDTMIQQLTALRTSDTAMLQNLFNAYGSRDTVQVPLIDIASLAPLEFVYDEHVLMMIENATFCPRSHVYCASPWANATDANVEAHVYVYGQHPDEYFNLPLQFHKDASEVTPEDIGWALRMHPAFLHQTDFDVVNSSGSIATQSAVTSDGYMGFVFMSDLWTARYKDDGSIELKNYTTRALPTVQELCVLNDFKAVPMFTGCTRTVTSETLLQYDLDTYTGHRDVELTYRLEDLAMHWTYLTIDLWAGNVVRPVTGTRMK